MVGCRVGVAPHPSSWLGQPWGSWPALVECKVGHRLANQLLTHICDLVCHRVGITSVAWCATECQNTIGVPATSHKDASGILQDSGCVLFQIVICRVCQKHLTRMPQELSRIEVVLCFNFDLVLFVPSISPGCLRNFLGLRLWFVSVWFW